MNLQKRVSLSDAASTDSTVGRLMTEDGVLFGYLALNTQQVQSSHRVGFLRVRRWSEAKQRYRLNLLDDWDEGFLQDDDEAQLLAGRFAFKGAIYRYEELTGNEARTAMVEQFAGWK